MIEHRQDALVGAQSLLLVKPVASPLLHLPEIMQQRSTMIEGSGEGSDRVALVVVIKSPVKCSVYARGIELADSGDKLLPFADRAGSRITRNASNCGDARDTLPAVVHQASPQCASVSPASTRDTSVNKFSLS